MSDAPAQNYENHAKTPTGFFAPGIPVALGTIAAIVSLFFVGSNAYPYILSAAVIVNGLATFGGIAVSRIYATKLQDRIIRTEMRIRLERVLPQDMHAQISNLSTGQLIALRFGSDEELPGMISKVVEEDIHNKGDIKRMVTDWQADDFRV